MFLIGQRVNCRNPAVFGKPLNIILSKGSYHRAVNHAPQDSGSIDDRFSSAQLQVVLRKKYDASPQFTNAYFKTHSRSGRRFTEDQCPGLPGEGPLGCFASICLKFHRQIQQSGQLLGCLRFNRKKMLHETIAARVLLRIDTASSISALDTFNGGNQRITDGPAGTVRRPLRINVITTIWEGGFAPAATRTNSSPSTIPSINPIPRTSFTNGRASSFRFA